MQVADFASQGRDVVAAAAEQEVAQAEADEQHRREGEEPAVERSAGTRAAKGERRLGDSAAFRRELRRDGRIEAGAHPGGRHGFARFRQALPERFEIRRLGGASGATGEVSLELRALGGCEVVVEAGCQALLHRFAFHRPAGHSTSFAALPGASGAGSARNASLSSFSAR